MDNAAQGQSFPFGRPVLSRPAQQAQKRKVFVLGVYPGAFHVAWTPPAPYKKIMALPVDNELEAFWNGEDELELFEAWKEAVHFDEGRWGAAAPAGRFNGATGKKLEERVLGPLSIARGDAWLTDCLDSYRASVDGAARVADTYQGFAGELGLAPSSLRAHPSESAIVEEALAFQLERLKAELAQAAPKLILTLGNAALRVMAALVEPAGPAPLPQKLSALGSVYGRRLPVKLGERAAELLPLAHPSNPAAYRTVHEDWLETRPSFSV